MYEGCPGENHARKKTIQNDALIEKEKKERDLCLNKRNFMLNVSEEITISSNNQPRQ